MKEIFPNEVQLIETIAAERNAKTSSFDPTSDNQLLFESEKVVDGKYYHLMATRAGEVGITEQSASGTRVTGGENNAKLKTMLFSYALNLVHGHEFISNVSYRSTKYGSSSNYVVSSSFYAWVNCNGSPSYSPSGHYWDYRGRSLQDPLVGAVYNNYRQVINVTGSGLGGQAYLR